MTYLNLLVLFLFGRHSGNTLSGGLVLGPPQRERRGMCLEVVLKNERDFGNLLLSCRLHTVFC